MRISTSTISVSILNSTDNRDHIYLCSAYVIYKHSRLSVCQKQACFAGSTLFQKMSLSISTIDSLNHLEPESRHFSHLRTPPPPSPSLLIPHVILLVCAAIVLLARPTMSAVSKSSKKSAINGGVVDINHLEQEIQADLASYRQHKAQDGMKKRAIHTS